jgi:hypothetical protein
VYWLTWILIAIIISRNIIIFISIRLVIIAVRFSGFIIIYLIGCILEVLQVGLGSYTFYFSEGRNLLLAIRVKPIRISLRGKVLRLAKRYIVLEWFLWLDPALFILSPMVSIRGQKIFKADSQTTILIQTS